MQLIVYLFYGAGLLTFLVLSGFAIFHSLRYHYISPRVKPVTFIFVTVSIFLILTSLFFLLRLEF